MKYYAIKKGRNPGIYNNWNEAKKQIDGYSGAVYKSFTTKSDAETFLNRKTEVKANEINDENNIKVYTDGGSRNTGNIKNGHVKKTDKAAWAYYINGQGITETDSAGEYGATNNRMEIMAFLNALTKLIELGKNEENIIGILDSKYVLDSINSDWIGGWAKRGWKKSDGKEVVNKELWQEVYKLLPQFTHLTLTWTKGHANNDGNNKVDELLNQTMDKM